MVDQKLKSRELALKVAQEASLDEREKLVFWLSGLLEIKNSEMTPLKKSREAVSFTSKQKVILPIIRSISKLVKKHLWDSRGIKGRSGLIGIGVGLTFFGGQSAGIAALGGAIGLPLWIVLGAGGAFAGVLLEELQTKKEQSPSGVITSYKVVDGE